MSEQSFHSEFADLAWADQTLPFSARFQDIYYAKQNPAGESQHVFIAGNQLASRWCSTTHKQQRFVIAELGFGAGLNFLLSWRLWQQCQRHPGWQKLHYIGYERYPLSTDELARLHHLWPELNPQSAKLLAHYQPDCTGLQRISIAEDLVLDLVIGDACKELERRHRQDQAVDAWFLDGFSPARNPELWSIELFRLLALHSHQDTTLATYSSAGSVRRDLQTAGFNVQKTQGFASKRHMLIANGCSARPAQSQQQSQSEPQPPWFQLPAVTLQNKSAIVVGAGLAGCHTAFALARRGWHVQVLESGPDLGQGVNGIPQLALRCRLFNAASVEARFYLQGYRHAAALFASLQKQEDCGWHECGLLQLEDALNKRSPLDREQLQALYPGFICSLSEDLSLPGFARNLQGFWFAHGGWLNPQKFCHRLLATEGIETNFNTSVAAIRPHNTRWQARIDERTCHTADVIVIANGAGITGLDQTSSLPLDVTLGQCTLIESREAYDDLGPVVCGKKSFFPALNGCHTIAATYRQVSATEKSIQQCNEENLRDIGAMIGRPVQAAGIKSFSRALRANTRDRMPMIGPLPNLNRMAAQYQALSRNAQQKFTEPGEYHSGLFITAAHGSNGLSTCPLGGEYLASLIDGDPLPLDRQIIDALNPCRFLIQDLKKQRLA